MIALEMIAFVLLLWAIGEFIVGTRVSRSRKQYQHRIREEQIRDYFAGLRQELLALALAGEIDVDSDLFQSLYRVQTFVLRRPDRYDELSKLLTKTLLIKNSEEISKTKLYKEAQQSPESVKKLIFRTGEGLFRVIFEFSTIFRIFATIEKRTREVSGTMRVIGGRVFRHIESATEDPAIKNIKQAQKNLMQLGTA
jgi:hypothetical protein